MVKLLLLVMLVAVEVKVMLLWLVMVHLCLSSVTVLLLAMIPVCQGKVHRAESVLKWWLTCRQRWWRVLAASSQILELLSH